MNTQQMVSPEYRTMRTPSRMRDVAVCAVCGELVSEHIAVNGRWKGCAPGKGVRGVKMILVADRRTQPAPVTTTTPLPRVAQPPTPTGPQVLYVARYPLSHPRVTALESQRDLALYRVIKKSRRGQSRGELLGALGEEAMSPEGLPRTGIVDGALRRLRIAGLVSRVTAKR